MHAVLVFTKLLLLQLEHDHWRCKLLLLQLEHNHWRGHSVRYRHAGCSIRRCRPRALFNI